MTPVFSHALQTTAFAPVPGHTAHLDMSGMFVPGPVAVLIGYLATLLVLLVLGVFVGWQKPGTGGNGGGGGRGKPPAPEPPAPGGREQPEGDDFAAWERQLGDAPAADSCPVPAAESREDVLAGR
jgi:hypothetical protein